MLYQKILVLADSGGMERIGDRGEIKGDRCEKSKCNHFTVQRY